MKAASWRTGKATSRMDIGFGIEGGISLYAYVGVKLKSLCGIHVAWVADMTHGQ